MKKKYYPVDISSYFSHKMMGDNELIDDTMIDQVGVAGSCISDPRFAEVLIERYIGGIRYRVYGQKSELDNIICRGQQIVFPDIHCNALAILGFNEFGIYKDKVVCTDKDDCIHNHTLCFYSMSENITSLYDCEKNDTCQIAVRVQSNGFCKLNIYHNIILMNNGVKEIVLPENPETHIFAMTIINEM